VGVGIILQVPRLEVGDLEVGIWETDLTVLLGESTNMIEILGTREEIEVGIGMVGGIGMSEEAISGEDLRTVGRVLCHPLTHEEVVVVVEVVRV